VLFRRADDRGLHRYIIEKTLQNAQLSRADAEAARQVKLEALEDMHALTMSAGRCFRRDLVRYFGAERPKPSRSLADWILRWVFAQGSPRARVCDCCDFCGRVHSVEAGLQWANAVLGQNQP